MKEKCIYNNNDNNSTKKRRRRKRKWCEKKLISTFEKTGSNRAAKTVCMASTCLFIDLYKFEMF